MEHLYLMRHGEPDRDPSIHYLGSTRGSQHYPLSVLGREQALEAARRILPLGIREIWSSPLPRALQTAEIVAELFGIDTIHTDIRLREIDFGLFEGMSREAVEECWPGTLKERYDHPMSYRFPDGETFHELGDRVLAALGEIRKSAAGPTLVTAHAGAILASLVKSGKLKEEEFLYCHVPFCGTVDFENYEKDIYL